ncbi:hypothetical protein TNCV_597961 [Trichonephila clavipes]|nr:hypothetical protein TNCV_597961 [Trichonephila clavipes]
MYVHRDAAKHGCDHFDAVNITWIPLKKRRVNICVPRFVVDHTIEDAHVCDLASRVATAMVSELRVHAAANVLDLFVQAFAVLQKTPVLDSGLVT